MRYSIFAHDPDGDMGHGRIIGPYKTAEAAGKAADRLERANEKASMYAPSFEYIVLPVLPGGASVRRVREELGS
jgi:hypothetical protein